MPKPTTIHQEVVEKYGKKPSERIREIYIVTPGEHFHAMCNAIIAYLDEEHERAVKEFSNK